MDNLNPKEKELVAIGAALGSNCVPCVVYHIKEARKNGLSDKLIADAIQVADKVRKVPAEKVLHTAYAQLEDGACRGTEEADEKPPCCER